MRDYKLYLDDILEAAKRIEKYTKGLTLEKLKKDILTIDGVVRNLEIIGEAAKNIPVNIKQKYAEIEWKKIAGLRGYSDTRVFWNRFGSSVGYYRK